MNRAIVLEALWRVTVWGIAGRGHRLRRAAGRQGGGPGPGAPQRR
jgi:hypothetical protein